MRGVGWAIAYQDPGTGTMSNYWIGLHEDGHPAGMHPLHYKPAERSTYIEAFFANVDWNAVAARLRPPSGH